MARFIFDLPDEDRALLEGLRVRIGARSHAEALRMLIRRCAEEPTGKERLEALKSYAFVSGSPPMPEGLKKLIEAIPGAKDVKIVKLPRPNAAKPGERLKKR